MTISKAFDVYRTAYAVLVPHKRRCPLYYQVRGPLCVFRDKRDES